MFIQAMAVLLTSTFMRVNHQIMPPQWELKQAEVLHQLQTQQELPQMLGHTSSTTSILTAPKK
jgi:hypothetical protein